MHPSGKEGEYPTFANYNVQEGPRDNGTAASPQFPDSEKKKQFASRTDQKSVQRSQPKVAPEHCKHTWLPLLEKMKVGVT